MKKTLSLALALMTCLCLAGCGDEPEENSAPTSSVTTPSAPASSVTTPSTSDNSAPAVSDTTGITMEPVSVEVTDITADPAAGYGYHHKSIYGNAFSLIYSYGSVDGSKISNATILVIPIQMTDLDEILATEWCANIKKDELTETDVEGVKSWISTDEAAQVLASACGDYTYDELFVELKVSDLMSKGASQEDALAQAMAKLADVGLGDVR